ncbi:Myosin assembly protein/sexual cycle protein and related proteins protein [Dioscorea alata]|uniref:Myosin assembly protein/sexual cycle protein and related proteins protein n=4 Tax=Dioscorea alata TaxID=55571 RepID=A0ACB7WK41_DIOAL|nr:Myosin assembly protein/sexual cycle protein and related proteins protein [Dioscorea alata]KAH7688428.1 Myosin assembly protein/sexual cycle protein and related proteins protein [Dioscorea alata]KAH7688429.1 Myosin assembly protein/sexual cycle protein and related proteins protein [Dioscorea alata]KAH7688430.1 Myosin assembly protein/sexual cycle protein and related proteins protein [Dioscorea alata]
MGRPAGKKKRQSVGGGRSNESTPKHKSSESNPRVFDDDMNIFIEMAQELKEEGNRLFQKRDYEGALLKYEKAVKLLPKNHVDVAYFRSNIAACYMQMGPEEYPRAIDECTLALEVSPKYSKALLKRARCFEACDQLELAFKDVDAVLSAEPHNLMALEICQRIKEESEKKGIKLEETAVVVQQEHVVVKEKSSRKKKSHKVEDKAVVEEGLCGNGKDEATRIVKEDKKIVVKEEPALVVDEEPAKVVKLVFGEDIRVAQLPANCSLLQLREVIRNRFPKTRALLIKYRDKEGDLVTITTTEELRWAEESADPQGSVRLYLVEVDPGLEPVVEEEGKASEGRGLEVNQNHISENGSTVFDDDKSSSTYIDHWIVQFARLFKNHVGFDSDAYLDLHELGMKLYSEAMEDAVTSEEAQEIFDITADKFQEMAALALFNWGNVHMSRARKRLFLSEDASKATMLAQIKSAYEWAKAEYIKAGKRYEEALKIKPDFYEGLLALGQQQFEQAKLSWYYAIGSKVDLETWPSSEVLELFNSAEENMEKGTEMWEEMEEQRLMELRKPTKDKTLLQKMGLDKLFKELSTDEAAEQATSMRSQINLLWGTMLYERSVVEFKLGFPIWEECLVAAVEKFKLAGASPSDIAVMVKNHCSNETAQEGLGFKIDEIVQAWNDMYDAKRWISGVPSFRLEPLFRRRVPRLHGILEHI